VEDAVRDIHLPAPDTTGGRPLMQVLRDRRSTRTFAARPLPLQVVSELLWATGGVNRPERGLRTAPTARNWQEIDVYVATADGLWRYEPVGHVLRFVHGRDVRAVTGLQPFVADAPLNLVYVVDPSKMGISRPNGANSKRGPTRPSWRKTPTFTAPSSAGLATVVRGHLDATALARALSLSPGRVPTLAQTIGYPAE